MRKRFIAVLVLASLVGYVMPLALLIAVHAMAMPASASHSPVKNDHSCCPGVHSRAASVVVTMDPVGMPCGGQHPCCARQVPDNLPSLPATSRRTTPDRSNTPLMLAQQSSGRTDAVPVAWTGHTFELYSERSTVLRI